MIGEEFYRVDLLIPKKNLEDLIRFVIESDSGNFIVQKLEMFLKTNFDSW